MSREAYTVEVRDHRGRVSLDPIFDPFVRTTIRPKPGLRARVATAAAALLGRLEYEVLVNGERERIEQVLELDPDYLGPTGSPSREAWDAHLNEALSDFVADAGESS